MFDPSVLLVKTWRSCCPTLCQQLITSEWSRYRRATCSSQKNTNLLVSSTLLEVHQSHRAAAGSLFLSTIVHLIKRESRNLRKWAAQPQLSHSLTSLFFSPKTCPMAVFPEGDTGYSRQCFPHVTVSLHKSHHSLDWIEQCFTSPPTQYRLYGRRFLQSHHTDTSTTAWSAIVHLITHCNLLYNWNLFC